MMSAPYTPRGISREDLLEIKRKAFLKFYMRPRILIRNILGIKSFGHFKFLFRRFYNWVIVKDHTALKIASADKEVAQIGAGVSS